MLKRVMKQKKGISPVIATILLILIVVVMIAIVWAGVRYFLSKGTEPDPCEKTDVLLSASDVCFDSAKKIASVGITKGPNNINITRLQLVFSYETADQSNVQEVIFDPNSKKLMYFDMSGIYSGAKPLKVKIIPVVRLSDGNERICEAKSEVSVSECKLNVQGGFDGWVGCTDDAWCQARTTSTYKNEMKCVMLTLLKRGVCCYRGFCAGGSTAGGGNNPPGTPPTGGCAAGQTNCGGTCVDTNINHDNCGRCGNACGAGTVCSDGQCKACVQTCNPLANVPCGINELKCSDGTSCGPGFFCATGQSCYAGICCITGQSNCGGTCVDTQTDESHCGSCTTSCAAGETCVSGACLTTTETCTDRIKNQDETDVDCGGLICPLRCADEKSCKFPTDCQSMSCQNDKCAAATCTDGIKNLDETDVDCGGNICPTCDDGKSCETGDDCKGRTCQGGICSGSSETPAYCYQECAGDNIFCRDQKANDGNCELDYTGSYSKSSTAEGGNSQFNDGDWTSSILITNFLSDGSYMRVIYKKPSQAILASETKHKFKILLGNGNILSQELVVPACCLNQADLDIRYSYQVGGIARVDRKLYVECYCQTGNYVPLGKSPYSVGWDAAIFEEAMMWKIGITQEK